MSERFSVSSEEYLDALAEREEARFRRLGEKSRLSPGGRGQTSDPILSGKKSSAGPAIDGTVVELGPSRVHVRTREGELVCSIPSHLACRQAEALAVGDRVRCRQTAPGEGHVTEVRPRVTVLTRPAPGNSHRVKVLAANVQAAVIVATLQDPPFRPGLVDRYLVALFRTEVRPILVVNKADLPLPAESAADLQAALDDYRRLGMPIFPVSALTGEGVDALIAAVAGQTIVLLGHSGVGKSSLANRLAPSAGQMTGEVRAFDGKGRHTTTGSRLLSGTGGCSVIDTPGIRSFGLGRLGLADVQAGFPEFRSWTSGCRFPDCRHLTEPECGVRDAVDAGRIPEARYRGYQRLLASTTPGS